VDKNSNGQTQLDKLVTTVADLARRVKKIEKTDLPGIKAKTNRIISNVSINAYCAMNYGISLSHGRFFSIFVYKLSSVNFELYDTHFFLLVTLGFLHQSHSASLWHPQ